MLSAGRCRRGGAVLMPPGRWVGLRPGMGRVARRAPALCSGSVSPVRETFGRRGGMAAASAFPALAACSSRFSHSAPPTGKESPGHETKDGPGRKKALAGCEAVRLCRCPAGSVPPWRCRAHASGPLFGPASGRGPCSPTCSGPVFRLLALVLLIGTENCLSLSHLYTGRHRKGSCPDYAETSSPPRCPVFSAKSW